MSDTLLSRDIIVVGQQPWDTLIGSNCKDIALEFSKHNRVLYVNAPLDRNTLLRQRHTPAVQQRLRVLRGQDPSLRAVADNLWVLTPATILESINWLPGGAIHTFFNKVNNRRFATAIQTATAELGFHQFLLFNDNDIFRSFYLPELLKPEVSIYYSRDFVVSTDYWKKHGVRLEPQLIAKSDVCVANSSYLADYCRRYNPASFDVGQGCDVLPATAGPAAVPPDLAALPRPIIGYVGALVSARLSLDVLRHISWQQPDWSIVLIGPEDETFKASDLHALPNVHFLGSKPPESLPDYVQHFDVCLNPQVVNDLTRGNYPRKVDEYLMLGRPVVASRTEAMRLFEAHTYLAETAEDYVRLIKQALLEDGAERQRQRRAFAATHTWKNSVGKIYQAVAAHYGRLAPTTARPAMPHPQPAA